MPIEIQEQLCNRYHVILTDHKTTKEKAINILNKIDFTIKEGAQTWDKYLGKIDKGFKKVDEVFEEFDKSLAKIGEDIKPKKYTKKKADDPLKFEFWD